jgi:AraC-like DNA-binding protein/tellurite resistance-related uncharacterized protein
MVTIQEIHDFLNHLTPQDEYYKRYYLQTGHLLSIEQLNDFWKKNPLPELPPSSLSFLDPAYHNVSESIAASSLRPHRINLMRNIKNNTYFNAYEGITIRKHSNYFPSFCHSHSFMEVCYVMKGQCLHHFYPDIHEKAPTDVITMNEHDLILIPPRIFHTIKSASDSVILNILVKPGALEKSISQYFTDDVPLFGYFAQMLYGSTINSFLLFHLEKNDFLDNLLDRMLFEYCNRQPMYPQIMNQILGLYFSIVQRSYGNNIVVPASVMPGTDYMPKFLLYLQSNYQHFSIDAMAEHFHLTSSYISRIFKANTGSTVIHTVMRIRLETAKNILENSSHSIDEIAKYVGYEDTTYFIRIFRGKYSMTPQQYRKHIIPPSWH